MEADLSSDDAELVDVRGRAAMAELRSRAHGVELAAVAPNVVSPRVQRRRTYAGAAAVLLVVAVGLSLLGPRREEVRSGPSATPEAAPARLVPTVWPAPLAERVTELSGPDDVAPVVAAAQLLAVDGRVAAVAYVTGPVPIWSVDSSPSPPLDHLDRFQIDGRDAFWESGNGRAHLNVRLDDDRTLQLSTYWATRAQLLEVATAVDGTSGELRPDALPAGWTVRPDRSGVGSAAFGAGGSPAITSLVGRRSSTYSGAEELLFVTTRTSGDPAGDLDDLRELVGPAGEVVDLGQMGQAVRLEWFDEVWLVWSPAPDTVAWMTATHIDPEEMSQTARSVVAVDQATWDQLTADARPRSASGVMLRPGDVPVAEGTLGERRWLLARTDDAEMPLMLWVVDVDGTQRGAPIGAPGSGVLGVGLQGWVTGFVPPVANSDGSRAIPGWCLVYVTGPPGLTEATIHTSIGSAETASVDLVEDGATLAFAVTLDDPAGPGWSRLTGTLAGGEPYQSGPIPPS